MISLKFGYGLKWQRIEYEYLQSIKRERAPRTDVRLDPQVWQQSAKTYNRGSQRAAFLFSTLISSLIS